ncbi:hypothetical protein BK126_03070 [Paenibacillus sp. FSL H7-0326]|nr:hypothetical protein BK126_03070 [Paenibacillus sp. FSL H7-0326]
MAEGLRDERISLTPVGAEYIHNPSKGEITGMGKSVYFSDYELQLLIRAFDMANFSAEVDDQEEEERSYAAAENIREKAEKAYRGY